jgi:hypothetical protein
MALQSTDGFHLSSPHPAVSQDRVSSPLTMSKLPPDGGKSGAIPPGLILPNGAQGSGPHGIPDFLIRETRFSPEPCGKPHLLTSEIAVKTNVFSVFLRLQNFCDEMLDRAGGALI